MDWAGRYPLAGSPVPHPHTWSTVPPVTTLTEALGHAVDDRLLVLTSDQLGMCHASNVGVYESLRSGLATGASLMVPGPWAREAAFHYRGEAVGVHLTLNAELDCYRWRPITHAPSLLDGDGGFPRTVEDLWDHADLDEARRECRAQLERAILWGFDVTHISSHMGALQNRPEFFDVYLELAVDFDLPMRLEGAPAETTAGFPFRSLAAEEGVLTVDYHRLERLADPAAIERSAMDLAPGVTELVVEPADDTPELRALCHGWGRRVEHRDLVCDNSELWADVDRGGVTLVSWREIRDVQRDAA